MKNTDDNKPASKPASKPARKATHSQANRSGVNTAARRMARHYAMQVLYQWQVAKNEPAKIITQFMGEYDMTNTDVDYFRELVMNISNNVEPIDQGFLHTLEDRAHHELDPITLALLRIGTYELQHRIDVPYKVAISEAVSLAKKFGATDSYKFINGVLDKASLQLRKLERG